MEGDLEVTLNDLVGVDNISFTELGFKEVILEDLTLGDLVEESEIHGVLSELDEITVETPCTSLIPKRVIGYEIQLNGLSKRLAKCKHIVDICNLESSIDRTLKGVIKYSLNQEDSQILEMLSDIQINLVDLLEKTIAFRKVMKENEDLKLTLRRLNRDFGIDSRYYINIGKGDLFRKELN